MIQKHKDSMENSLMNSNDKKRLVLGLTWKNGLVLKNTLVYVTVFYRFCGAHAIKTH